MVAAGVEYCKVSQLCVSEAGETKCEAAQDNTPTLPGYSKAELHSFQALDPALSVLTELWNRQRKLSPQEKVGLSKQVHSSLKRWQRIKKKDGLLYCVIDDGHLGQYHQLLFPLPVSRSKCLRVCMTGWGTRAKSEHWAEMSLGGYYL